MIQTLRRNFDYVVIDTPPGFDDQVLGAFDETDECIIVATLDVPTIKNTKVAIETLDLLHLVPQQPAPGPEPRRRGGGPLAGATWRSILGMKVSVSLPSSPAVASATNHGQPIVLSKPDHPVSKAINGLARQFVGEAARPPRRASPPSAACSGARRSE